MKTCLITDCGGMHGAYSAGVLSELCRKLGNNYFSRIKQYDKIIIVNNREENYDEKKIDAVLRFRLFSLITNKKIRDILWNYHQNLENLKDKIKRYPNIYLIEASEKIPITSLVDTNKKSSGF